LRKLKRRAEAERYRACSKLDPTSVPPRWRSAGGMAAKGHRSDAVPTSGGAPAARPIESGTWLLIGTAGHVLAACKKFDGDVSVPRKSQPAARGQPYAPPIGPWALDWTCWSEGHPPACHATRGAQASRKCGLWPLATWAEDGKGLSAVYEAAKEASGSVSCWSPARRGDDVIARGGVAPAGHKSTSTFFQLTSVSASSPTASSAPASAALRGIRR